MASAFSLLGTFFINELGIIVNFVLTITYSDALMYSQDLVVLFVIVTLTLKRQFDFKFVLRYFKKSDFVKYSF